MDYKTDIVSQNELDALLNILNKDEPIDEKTVQNRDYKFSHKAKNNDKRFEFFQNLSKNFATNISLTLKNRLDKKIEINFQNIKFNPTEEGKDDILKFQFKTEVLSLNIKLFISKMAINSIIDLYLGGDGVVSYQNQTYSEIEKSVFDYFLKDISKEIDLSWGKKRREGKIYNKFVEIEFKILMQNQIKFFLLRFEEKRKDDLSSIYKELKKLNFLNLKLDFIISQNNISIKKLHKLRIGSMIKLDNFKKKQLSIKIGKEKIFLAQRKKERIVVRKILGKRDEF